MAILAIALFGSRARGDFVESSDTDLLLWTDDEHPRKEVAGKLSLSFYPVRFLLEKAREGDLFAAHIVREAKPLYDPHGHLERLRLAYIPSQELQQTIRHASDLGRFVIAHWRKIDSFGLVDRRIAWTVRTILIAKACQDGSEPHFATSDLVSFAKDPSIADLIAAKDEPVANEGRVDQFRQFLDDWGDPQSPQAGDVEAYHQLFEDTGNSFGLSTLRRMGEGADDIY